MTSYSWFMDFGRVADAYDFGGNYMAIRTNVHKFEPWSLRYVRYHDVNFLDFYLILYFAYFFLLLFLSSFVFILPSYLFLSFLKFIFHFMLLSLLAIFVFFLYFLMWIRPGGLSDGKSKISDKGNRSTVFWNLNPDLLMQSIVAECGEKTLRNKDRKKGNTCICEVRWKHNTTHYHRSLCQWKFVVRWSLKRCALLSGMRRRTETCCADSHPTGEVFVLKALTINLAIFL